MSIKRRRDVKHLLWREDHGSPSFSAPWRGRAAPCGDSKKRKGDREPGPVKHWTRGPDGALVLVEEALKVQGGEAR